MTIFWVFLRTWDGAVVDEAFITCYGRLRVSTCFALAFVDLLQKYRNEVNLEYYTGWLKNRTINGMVVINIKLFSKMQYFFLLTFLR